MIFKQKEIRKDMGLIYKELDGAWGEYQVFLKSETKTGTGGGVRKSQERLQAETNKLFNRLSRLVSHEVYGRVSVASKETRDYLYPYYGKGFVRYSMRMDVRRTVLYRNDGSMLEVKQLRNGFVTVEEGRYVQIKGLVMVEDQWRVLVDRRSRQLVKG